VLIDPKIIQVSAASGVEKSFVISKLPYGSAGREILTQFVPTATPKIGDYNANHALFLKMMKYVAIIRPDGTEQLLLTQELVDNHVTDFKMGITLEKEMLEYNVGFFAQGSISSFSTVLSEKLPVLISKILMVYKEQSLAAAEQRSTNSEQSTQ